MNPDGSIKGNHRTNTHGLNLNRQWHQPSKKLCPEVYYVQKKMKQTGVDLFLDVHGDEEIPYSFIMSASNNCSLSKRASIFKSNLEKASADFQTAIDYNSFNQGKESCCGSSCGNKDTSKANDYVADKFNCLSLVLEMPFIDNKESEITASIQRNKTLGKSILKPISLAIKQTITYKS